MKKISACRIRISSRHNCDLDEVDSIRCFFCILFLARDQKVDLEQIRRYQDYHIKEELTN